METKTNRYRTWGGSRGNRLPADLYPSGRPVHVIVGTHHSQPVFGEDTIARAVFSLLEDHPKTLAACLMPDHLHWVLTDAHDLSRTIGRFKSFATHAVRKAGCHPPQRRFWQRSFWDHVIRADEDLEQTIDYILANPVRAGLVASAEEYPWRLVRWEES